MGGICLALPQIWDLEVEIPREARAFTSVGVFMMKRTGQGRKVTAESVMGSCWILCLRN